ncbi:LAFE_0C01486g1_1 [Lachancea fermentati]|uniref:Putative lipase ATG15 n=1 Tax=Lachancea fermentati TaxID=4955 RepID=A0A1G4M917_LACFM|nr:LAFE_0C01486g1_1 [Lachancea fermentati]
MKEKSDIGANKRLATRWRVFVLALIACGILSWLSFPLHCPGRELPDQKRTPGTFKLKTIYRHAANGPHAAQQKLDITPQLLEKGRAEYAEHLSIKQEGDDELWTSNELYATNNPLDFEFKLKVEPIRMTRMMYRSPEFVESYLDFALENPDMAAKVDLDWVNDIVLAPNISDKDTILSLALMSSNAYVRLPHTGDWRNVTEPWHNSGGDGHGWDGDGIRGHIFVNEVEDVVVISIKGTSAQGLAGSGEDDTTGNDKVNDNLLFSCCCARVSYLWTTVCDCFVKSYTCDETCLERELRRKDRYYSAVLDVYKQVLKDYPSSTIWVTGHSLGGAMASFLGRTYGLPTVTFEAPGELLATRRLHLPMPPGLPAYLEGVWHFGHTADPIYIGTCNGASSSCSIAGYAFETSCHSGKVCTYDVVNDKGWHVNMLNHRIHTVIDNVLSAYDKVAKCKPPEPCHDCYNWNYIQGRDTSTKIQTETKTSKSKTKTKTKDLPTSTLTSVTSTTDFTTPEPTASSCIGRNWFGICTRYGL